MLERLNEEIKRRTHVVRIFPNAESCLRLMRALAVETHENWLEANRYLNRNPRREPFSGSQKYSHFFMKIWYHPEIALEVRPIGSRSEAGGRETKRS